MSKVRVELKGMEVTKGNEEGTLEFSIQVSDGPHKVYWPDPYPEIYKVDQGGALVSIGLLLGSYTLSDTVVKKRYRIVIYRRDEETHKQHEIGVGEVGIEARNGEASSVAAAIIQLHEKTSTNGEDINLGEVKIFLSTQQIQV